MKLSLVIPVYNEEEALPHTLAALDSVLALLNIDYEVLFVDDGSGDGSFDFLTRAAERNRRIKILRFSRNFGHQAAVTAGLDFASGDAVIVMDADLQDPPELIPEMLRLYEEGYEVVSPQRISRDGDTYFKRITAGLFYRLMSRMVDRRMREEVGDFRLLSRGAINAMRQFREQHRFLRGMIAWLGLREAVLPFERKARVAGTTKYPFWKMARFSWTAITSFSAAPLHFTMGLGLAACTLAFLYFLFAVVAALVFRNVVSGWTSIVALQCLFFGVTLICIGLIGDYVARIYEESKSRPLYVIGEAVNASQPVQLERAVLLEPRSVPHEAVR